MKKLGLLLCAIVAGFISNAQTIANSDMEVWHSGTAGGGLGGGPTFTTYAPNTWFGLDSVIITDGELYGPLVGLGNDWKVQLFQEDVIVNGGLHSAKLMTLKQDTMGDIGGIMSNAKMDLDVTALLSGSLSDPLQALTFTGGTATTLRIMTVSAYVKLLGGIDTSTHMMGGNDTGMFAVQAVCTAYGADSVIGQGFVLIPPTSAFTQMTVNVTYTDTASSCDLVRIIFSSGSIFTIGSLLDSTTLYVDDVTMTGVTQHYPPPSAVSNTTPNAKVKVYPNPAKDMLYLETQSTGLNASLMSITGQIVATQALTSKNCISTKDLPNGIYVYTISDNAGNTVQRGNVSVKQ